MQINKELHPNTKAKEFIENINFFDSYTITLDNNRQIQDIYLQGIVNTPKWVEFLMLLRNKIAKRLGLASVNEINKNYDFTLGEKVGMFTLYFINKNEIITGEKDKHLDFCVSFLKEDKHLTVSTLVSYNNSFGKLYFSLIKPFHKIIVKNMMKKLQNI